MHDSFMKLRAVAIQAYAKMILRSRDNRPGKWPKDGYDAVGIRDWRRCSYEFLFAKFDEEMAELKDAVLLDASSDSIIKEAGDVLAVAMMIADRRDCFILSRQRVPTTVCLCGSTKFKQEFMDANFRETMKGNIVLSVGFFHHSDTQYILRDSEKEDLDFLHKRKIDLADEILVINKGGYVGSSTQSEIEYALSTGKTVRWLEKPAVTTGVDQASVTPPVL